MIRVTVRAGDDTPSSSNFTRTLLDGASLYGVSLLDSGRYKSAIIGAANESLTDALADYPAQTDVRDGVHYANGGNEGNMTEPAESDVKDGVQYGANGTEFEGALASGGAAPLWTW